MTTLDGLIGLAIWSPQAILPRERHDGIAEPVGSWQKRAVLKVVEPELERHRVELRDARNDLLDVRGILAPNGQPDVTPVSLVPTVAPAVAWLAAEVARYQPAVIGSTNIGTPIVLWMHACGFAESFGDDWRPEDGGCDACESGSNDPSDWQPLYVRRGAS